MALSKHIVDQLVLFAGGENTLAKAGDSQIAVRWDGLSAAIAAETKREILQLEHVDGQPLFGKPVGNDLMVNAAALLRLYEKTRTPAAAGIDFNYDGIGVA